MDLKVLVRRQDTLLRAHDIPLPIATSPGATHAAVASAPPGHPAPVERGRGVRTRGGKATSSVRATSSCRTVSSASSSRIHSSSAMHTLKALGTVVEEDTIGEEETATEETTETTSTREVPSPHRSSSLGGHNGGSTEDSPTSFYYTSLLLPYFVHLY
ncbi:hypothetical protein U1Q18_007741 [Sarracenia purpurea var. burkii]